MPTKGKSKSSKMKLDKDSTILNPTSVVQLELPLFATAESQGTSKETTYTDNSHLDELISRVAKTAARKRYRLKKAADRIRLKIRNLVDELHHQIAKFLVDNFDIILLPTFETSQMAVRKSRKIRSKTVRQMLTWSHYRFKQFLKHKAFETGKLVLDVSEAYTSKTVSWTGEVIQNLGGRKKITSSDGRIMDRDLNGGRGIFLRSLVDIPSLRDCIVNVS